MNNQTLTQQSLQQTPAQQMSQQTLPQPQTLSQNILSTLGLIFALLGFIALIYAEGRRLLEFINGVRTNNYAKAQGLTFNNLKFTLLWIILLIISSSLFAASTPPPTKTQ